MTCTIDGCTHAPYRRGLCWRHYAEAKEAGTLAQYHGRSRDGRCPDNHRHAETRNCYSAHGCRCEACKGAEKAHRKQRPAVKRPPVERPKRIHRKAEPVRSVVVPATLTLDPAIYRAAVEECEKRGVRLAHILTEMVEQRWGAREVLPAQVVGDALRKSGADEALIRRWSA